METKLYNLMNWRDIEGILYSDMQTPGNLLGQHVTKDGLLIQAYLPGAKQVFVKNMETNRKKEMELADEAGFFAALLPGKKPISYQLVVTGENGMIREFYDPYAFTELIPEDVLSRFNAGIQYDMYRYLGAHVAEINGVSGVRFAVWAPFAARVSVVGDFNEWDSRVHQMTMREDSGVFEIFIPGLSEGEMYKYEIRTKSGALLMKYDPYAFQMEALPGDASIVDSVEAFKWSDAEFLKKRATKKNTDEPFNILEIEFTDLSDEASEKLIAQAKNMGYTHVKLTNVIDYVESPRAYFAPNAAAMAPIQLMKFVDKLHAEEIGVIMEIPMQHFSSEDGGLAVFDGTCLYEHSDMKKGYHPKYDTKLFNYGRPEVSCMLINSAMFWNQVYHMDGIVIAKTAAMIYLDYDKKPGEWTGNIYGGNENLEALELFRHMNSMFKKLSGGAMIMAQDNSGYQNLTGSEVTSECFGFDFKNNDGWRKDLIEYLAFEPYLRPKHYHELTMNSVYAYNDSFVLPISGEGALLDEMVGATAEKKLSNLKLALGYAMTYPGKKLLRMDENMLSNESLTACVKDLNNVYKSEPSMYELDSDEDGFEWINNISANECIVSYARKGKKSEDMLVIVCNFEDVDRDDYKIGVPKPGKYKEIFNTDSEKYGGNGFVNPRLKQSKTDECDGRAESIRIKVPALGVTILKYSKADKEVKDNKTLKKNASAKTEAKKAEPKKEEPKKIATKKEEPKKLETKKAEPKKIATKKEEPKKLETKKAEPKKIATKKEEPKKLETKKEEPKKVAAKKAEPKEEAAKKAEPKKEESKKTTKKTTKTTKK